jgi:hypothetical protein
MKITPFALVLSFVVCACAQEGVASTQSGEIVLPKETVQVVTVDTLYTCRYKYDSKYNVEFLASKRTDFSPPQFPNLKVYKIVDTKGGHWLINEYDWLNYRCAESTQGEMK